MTASNLTFAWAQLLLRSLAHAGVRDVVVSPGSRSTPLALAAHEASDLHVRFVLDERAAAFFALGQARVTGRPTALICTSGTAAAHYFPAVIEASMSGVPLIAITADRPWELQGTGASQTIDQTRLFGDFARGFFAIGAPEPTEGALRAVARTAAQAVARALGPEPGPVQINAPFRKPLEPVASPEREAWTTAWEALMVAGPTRAVAASFTLDPSAIEACARLVQRSERGLLVCGPAPAHGDVDAYRREVLALARVTGFPIFAEATSQVRFGLAGAVPGAAPGAAPVIVSSFDALLRSPAFRRRMSPDVILEIGAPPTSSGYAQLLAEHPRCPRVVVASPGWTDPTSTATAILRMDLASFRAALRVHLAGLEADRVAAWSRALSAADTSARAVIDDQVAAPLFDPAPGKRGRPASVKERGAAGETSSQPAERTPAALSVSASPAPSLTEALVVRAVVDACPPGSTLVLGNSSPVRDIDTYCPASSRPLRVLHQRGASGIDGLVSGAAGAASVARTPVTLLLGDLSLIHDLGGLALAREHSSHVAQGSSHVAQEGSSHVAQEGSPHVARAVPPVAPLVIVTTNNGGGRIFEQLPIGRVLGAGPTFERCFATPQSVDFAAAAAAFGVPFERASSPADLAAALARAHASPGPTLIEAVVPPHDGAARLQALWARTAEALSPPENTDQPRTKTPRKDEAS